MEAKLQSEIHAILSEINSLEKVQSHLDEIIAQIDISDKELSKLDKIVDDELKDIENLEKIGLKSLFQKVLGSKEEQLELERQEYLEATLKYNDHKKTNELLYYEKDLLEKKTGSVKALKKELDTLKSRREKAILQNNSPIASELLHISNKLDECFLLDKELREAIAAGEESKQWIIRVLNQLKKAKQWGQWDMVTKGRGANYSKRHAIDQANAIVHKVQYALKNFERELRDIGMDMHIPFKMQNFNSFIDFFFDNLISDWIVQQKINNTYNNVLATHDRVEQITRSLNLEIEKLNGRKIQLQVSRDKILES